MTEMCKHGANTGHTHQHEEPMDMHEAGRHLRTDGIVLGAVASAATASEIAGVSTLKTGLSLGGEDAWWVLMNAREAWHETDGSMFRKLSAGMRASKLSLGTLIAVGAATPSIDHAVNVLPEIPAALTFSAAAVVISSVAMTESYINDRLVGKEPTEYKKLSRRFRGEGITLTFALGIIGHKAIADGNAVAMSIVGGTDCIWTAGRSWWYAYKNRNVNPPELHTAHETAE